MLTLEHGTLGYHPIDRMDPMNWMIDSDSSIPPFEQLRQQIAAAIASGDLKPGDRLPTVRSLAGSLGLAVNTVARAYRELEAIGAIQTEGRRGSFVSRAEYNDETVQATATAYIAAAQRAGLGRAEAHDLLDRLW